MTIRAVKYPSGFFITRGEMFLRGCYADDEVVMVAKGKFTYWLTPEGLVLLEGWARDGLTDAQIAHNVGITATTLYEWKNRFPEISDTLKKGKEIVDYEVENALLSKARSGDVGACIFWLKNRRRDKWKDKPDVSETVDSGGVIEIGKVEET